MSLPAGYVRVTAGRCEVVVRREHEGDARILLSEGTLYEAAARDLRARVMRGRRAVYAFALPASNMPAVVRHNVHGGLFAPLTRDLFLPPTRAPYELAVSLRLAREGVPTPAVLMYGLERTRLFFCRSDVVTREIADGRDLASYLVRDADTDERAAAWMATRTLVHALNRAGARHHDLNVKNVLLAPGEHGLTGYLLDVDRVVFGEADAATIRIGNCRRLHRSAIKWREVHGAIVDPEELQRLDALGAGPDAGVHH